MEQRPFSPSRGANQVVSPAVASASVTLDKAARSVRLVNSGANICYVRIGEGAQTATTADLPVRSAESVVVAKGDGGHIFARTLAEHNANVQKWYQLRRERGEM